MVTECSMLLVAPKKNPPTFFAGGLPTYYFTTHLKIVAKTRGIMVFSDTTTSLSPASMETVDADGLRGGYPAGSSMR